MAIRVSGTTVVDDSRNLANVANATFSGTLNLSTTGAMVMPVGTTAQQPSAPINGMIRYNTTNDTVEIYKSNANAWVGIGETRGRLLFFGSIG